MRRRSLVGAGLLVITWGAVGSAQSPQALPSVTEWSAPVRLCVEVVAAGDAIAPGSLTPDSLTQRIADGSVRIVTVDDSCATPATSPGPVTSPSPEASSAAVTLTIEARDLSFHPHDLTLAAGQTATLEMHNAGYVVHNFTIDEAGVQVVVSPGTTGETTIPALAPGTYTFYCSVSGHRQAGMEGTLTVK